MDGSIDTLYADQRPRTGGLLLGMGLSLVLHVTLMSLWLARQPVAPLPAAPPPLQYIELSPPSSQQFTEAPGAAIERPPSRSAPMSDANRSAATPNPTGNVATSRPGDGTVFNPEASAAAPQQRAAQAQAVRNPDAISERSAPAAPSEQQRRAAADAETSRRPVDWNSAIRDAGSTGSGTIAIPASSGGEEGFAESGPISFESQWYEWGPYSALMVAKIRYHWFRNMPDIVKMGIKGVVTIRFTIQRSGAITDVEIVKTSGTPPLDFAARKAIELASPLQPLPADFPSSSERVTASFYYNMKPPAR